MTRLLSTREFRNTYDIDFIVASNAEIRVGDVVWDAVGITPPKFVHPGMPSNVFLALAKVGAITDNEAESWRKAALELPFVAGDLADVSINIDGAHAGSFHFPAIIKLKTKISEEKMLSFAFSDIQVRVMSGRMRLALDRELDSVEKSTWRHHEIRLGRGHVITQTYHGTLSVAIDRAMKVAADVEVLTQNGFSLAHDDSVSRHEIYKMNAAAGIPFAMRTELVRGFTV